ncbi:mannose-6-phosphate isomerase, class I [Aspergillus luchuensis IFO 4308]|nr:mannose-6-phosphate isomerase, class I [Aspergillus luchuensis IFO 4308]
MTTSVFQLKCGIKNDPWGKQGKNSLAGVLCSKTPGTIEVEDDQHYSEMWMGTYPTVPSRILATGELLSEYLQKHPEVTGEGYKKWGTEVPFLPKVHTYPLPTPSHHPVINTNAIFVRVKILSFQKALPLQIHPDKKLAEKLHESQPDKYSDPNHKPEIAIALSNFELFVGFKPLHEIENLFKLAPLQRFLPTETNAPTFDDSLLREISRILLTLPPILVSETISSLLTIPEAQFGPNQRYIPGLLTRLKKMYPDTDNGSLVATILMNYMTLGPGEAVCVPADSMHAYLTGDIMECMARSDNVINTGFCPKAESDDVDLFTGSLSFTPHDVDSALLRTKKSDVGKCWKTEVYEPPFSEFSVLGVRLGKGEKEVHRGVKGVSLLVVVKGSGWMGVEGEKFELKEGWVYFVGAGVEVNFETEGGLLVYRPFAE